MASEWFFEKLMRKVLEIHTGLFARNQTIELLQKQNADVREMLETVRAGLQEQKETTAAMVSLLEGMHHSMSLMTNVLTAVCFGGDEVVPDTDESQTFELLADLGVITFPDGYIQDSALSDFRTAHAADFRTLFGNQYDALSTQHVTRVLRPGDRFRVRIFVQTRDEDTTTSERVKFLDAQGSTYLGMYGAMLLWKQKREQLPRDLWLTSFEGSIAAKSLSTLLAEKDDVYRFDRASLWSIWTKKYALISFTDAPD